MGDAEAAVTLAAFLGRAAEACREAFAMYIADRAPALRFQRSALFAVATLEGCAGQTQLDTTDIRLARDASSDAAAVCRTEEPSEAVMAVAALLEEVVAACDPLLGGDNAYAQGWRRFLFEDANVQVRRAGRDWRIRTAVGEAADHLLDIALEMQLSLSNHRIAELTVQILAWHMFEETHEAVV